MAKLKQVAERLVGRSLRIAASWSSLAEDRRLLSATTRRLSGAQRREVQELWARVPIKVHDAFHRVAAAERGFDARFVPEHVYNPYLLGALNPALQSAAWEHKAMYAVLFPDLPQPRSLLCCVSGQWFNGSGAPVSRLEAGDILLDAGEMIAKPAVYSDSGQNVVRLGTRGGHGIPARRDDLLGVLDGFGGDFVVQELVSQHEINASFNPASVNTVRVTSLYLNGRVSLHTPVFRCGQGASVVDNLGAGGIIIGLDDSGALAPFGYDLRLRRHERSSTGVAFRGQAISGYPRLLPLLEKTHRRMPTVRLAGWDFAFDRQGDPVMLEINTAFPGIIFEQLCSGPMFGDRTKEVIDFASRNPPRLRLAF